VILELHEDDNGVLLMQQRRWRDDGETMSSVKPCNDDERWLEVSDGSGLPRA
jgi:hypothetical protein